MNKIQNDQCRSCGAPLAFDVQTGKLQCEFCGSGFDPLEYELEDGEEEETWGVEEGMRSYVCPSCGAELICDQNTAASSCPYCGNNGVMPGQFSGIRRPEFILPFRVSRDQAVAALKKHYQGKLLLPKAFKRENQIRKIQGVYVPFWLFDREVSGDARYAAVISREHREGDYIVTENKHYQVYRSGEISFHKVPVDASGKMPDDYMDSLEPFDYGELKPFSASYMPGFLADKYDVDQKTAGARADLRCRNSLEAALRETVKGYDLVELRQKEMQITKQDAHYAMLPVWLLTTRWRDQAYLFAINGQTGKPAGDLPADKGKLYMIFFAVFLLGGFLLSLCFGENISAWLPG